MTTETVHHHLLYKLNAMKQEAVREISALLGAEERLLHLREHVKQIDSEFVGIAQRVKDSGAYITVFGNNVTTVPDEAKALLTANAPPPPVEDAEIVEKAS